MTFISARGLDKSYITGESERKVLDGLSIEVDEGRLILIMGPSGSGKTTLLNILGGIDRPDKGNLKVGNRDLTDASREALRNYRREEVGFIFQFYNLMPNLTVRENVELACEVLDWKSDKAEREALAYIESVGLTDKVDKFPQQLSGGEQQRVAIARGLAKHPKVIFGDEPTGNLDEETSINIIELLRDVNRDYNTTMVIVSHDRGLQRYADSIYELTKGKLEEV